ncbi:MAG: hypothetical protein GWO24_07365, partial [Akkermansiaceae bacterium]|nr:hypothetical protein [Akkermansiaceae bacterium]
AKGRGGVAAAARKFRVSPLSINNWLKKGGAGAGKPSGERSVPSGGGRDQVLRQLTT